MVLEIKMWRISTAGTQTGSRRTNHSSSGNALSNSTPESSRTHFGIGNSGCFGDPCEACGRGNVLRGGFYWEILHEPLVRLALQDLRLIALQKGEEAIVMGMGHRNARVRNEVYILPGCSVPVILRRERLGHRDVFKLVGDAVVPEVMEGQKWRCRGNEPLVDVELI